MSESSRLQMWTCEYVESIDERGRSESPKDVEWDGAG